MLLRASCSAPALLLPALSEFSAAESDDESTGDPEEAALIEERAALVAQLLATRKERERAHCAELQPEAQAARRQLPEMRFKIHEQRRDSPLLASRVRERVLEVRAANSREAQAERAEEARRGDGAVLEARREAARRRAEEQEAIAEQLSFEVQQYEMVAWRQGRTTQAAKDRLVCRVHCPNCVD